MASLLLLFFIFTAQTFTASSSKTQQQTYIILINPDYTKPSIFPTHYHWYTNEFTNQAQLLHVYKTLLHGFSASLTPQQASMINNHPSVMTVLPDRRRQLHTTRSPQFLGLRNQRGLWSESHYGDDVIIGIFDTGIWPERRSFSDRNLGPIPKRWRGLCEVGDEWGVRHCNRKIVGARFFSKGQFGAFNGGGFNRSVEFNSPRDGDGHGTHTASTAAGRYVFRASMEGYASGIAKGVAPKARLAVYKVCYKDTGCFDSDILAAFDAAVADGVDVISISIGGGGFGISPPYYLDPIAIGAFGAMAKGVFVSSSAGNEGPTGMSVTNLAPWMTTVGSGTIDRNFPADVVLGDGRKIEGVSLYAGAPLGGRMFPLVYPGKSNYLSASLCMEESLNPRLVRGKIVVCDRGSNARVAKGLVVKKAGGIGMILANGVSNGESLVGDAHLIPACGVGAREGDIVKAYVSKFKNATATINFKGTIVRIKPAPVVASFSGRGPNGMNPEILKPDLIAPGVNILAAWTEAVGPSGLDSDARKNEFNIVSGTSMACPHVSGAAALLKSAHPDWSPAAIRSAMMTTASTIDNEMQLISDEASGNLSTNYDYGAGHLNLDRAMDPGLVYDITEKDYINFLCGIGYEKKTIQVITRSQVNCPARKPLPENLNYPAISAVFPSLSNGVFSMTFIRIVTNVGVPNCVYKAKVKPPKGVNVVVKPTRLVFSEAVKKRRYMVTVTTDSRNLVLGESGAVFGSLSWWDGIHAVRSPIVVTEMSVM